MVVVGLAAPSECVDLYGAGGSVAPFVVPDDCGGATAYHQYGEVPEGVVEHSSATAEEYQDAG